jgi:glucose/mannose-6-phosphate isomerase
MELSYDKSNLRSVILDSLTQADYTFTVENEEKLPDSISNVILHGMGGSALPAEVLNSSWYSLGVSHTIKPIYIHRDYETAPYIDDTFLSIASSYSGNTEETVSALETTIAKGIPTVVISAGGKLIEKARELKLPYVVLPKPGEMFQPRYATLYMVKAILTVLVKIGYIPNSVLSQMSLALTSVNPADFEAQGKDLASKLVGKTPVLYTSQTYQKVSHLWKIKINENAKTPAFHNYFPELNHNEMVGFTLPQAKFHFVLIKNQEETSRNIKRMEVMKGIFEKNGLDVTEISVPNYGTFFANVVAMILIGDWTAYYLALANQIDPTPVEMVETFKALME